MVEFNRRFLGLGRQINEKHGGGDRQRDLPGRYLAPHADSEIYLIPKIGRS